MKLILIIQTLLFLSIGLAQDCVDCLPDQNFVQPLVPEWPIEYTSIERISYDRNSHASFCKRPIEMIDTVVIHHSETPSTDTAERINQFHLSRGTSSDPWYMIAYSYVINSPYPGANIPITRVTEGRPLDIVGAHAGSNVFVPMDKEQKSLWDEGKITCGKENEDFKFDPSLVKDGKIKANVTTIGLVVIGNYALSRGQTPMVMPALSQDIRPSPHKT